MKKIEANNPNQPKNNIPKTTGIVQKSIIYMFNCLIKTSYHTIEKKASDFKTKPKMV